MRTKLLKLKPTILDEAGPGGGSGDLRIPEALESRSASSVPRRSKVWVFLFRRCSPLAILDHTVRVLVE